MKAYRPDHLVAVLTSLVSLAYYGLGVVAAVVLVGIPTAKLLAEQAGDVIARDLTLFLPVPANVEDVQATVLTTWGPVQLELRDVRGELGLPVSMLPWWFLSVLWAYAALELGLMLAALHHFRRILQRVKDGAPFDNNNALRLRTLGVLALAIAVSSGIAEFFTSLAVSRGLVSGPLVAPAGWHINAPLVALALVLIGLAEVFRRGADLETEQALVV